MERIVVIGSSGHAKVVIDVVEKARDLEIVGLVDSFRPIGESTMGYAVLGKEEELPHLAQLHGVRAALIAVGDNFVRAKIAVKVRKICPQLTFAKAVHPSASIARDVTIGAGTVVMAGAVLNPSAAIGRFCIVNTSASLDHDSTLGDYASLAPRASVGGNTAIGAYSAIGIGAAVTHGRTIGAHAVIGAGAAVVRDIASHTVAYGVPAVAVRSRREGEKYL